MEEKTCTSASIRFKKAGIGRNRCIYAGIYGKTAKRKHSAGADRPTHRNELAEDEPPTGIPLKSSLIVNHLRELRAR
ncbi:hypothetical protein [Cohnella sp. GCM10012308]|uniref:hypothetical protein n=1 Tax=Cohnella sp. GCM10012308 TaxID=3317329 RepID=UPI003607E0B7